MSRDHERRGANQRHGTGKSITGLQVDTDCSDEQWSSHEPRIIPPIKGALKPSFQH
jgi:hypothetical protein